MDQKTRIQRSLERHFSDVVDADLAELVLRYRVDETSFQQFVSGFAPNLGLREYQRIELPNAYLRLLPEVMPINSKSDYGVSIGPRGAWFRYACLREADPGYAQRKAEDREVLRNLLGFADLRIEHWATRALDASRSSIEGKDRTSLVTLLRVAL